MKNTKSMPVLHTLTSLPTFAQDKAPPPSGLTETNTSVYVDMSNKDSFKNSISADINFSNGQQGMLTIDATMDNPSEYTGSPFKYFHAFNTQNDSVPKVAILLDALDCALFIVAFPRVTLTINSAVKGLNIFPRVGVLAGKFSEEVLVMAIFSDQLVICGSTTLYVFYTAGNDITYLGLPPEYCGLSADVTCRCEILISSCQLHLARIGVVG